MASIRDSIKNKGNVQPGVAKMLDKHQQRESTRDRNESRRGNETRRANEQSQRGRNDNRRNGVYPYFKDGIDHINIWTRGETPLGRALSMEAPMHIETQYGKFRNIYALWVFLTTKDHPVDIASWDDTELRRWVRARVDIDREVSLPNTAYVCIQELANYITANKELVNSLILSGDAFFDSYINHEAHGPFPHQHRDWWVGGINLIRAQLQAGQKVNVSAFLEDEENPYPVIEANQLPRLGEIVKAPSSKEKPKGKTKAKKGPITQEEREKMRQECRVDHEKFVESLNTPNPDRTMYFSTEQERREVMIKLVLNPKTELSSDMATEGTGLPLFVWLTEDGQAIKMVSTSMFGNPYRKDAGQVVTVNDMETFYKEVREMLCIPDAVPNELIHYYVLQSPEPKKPEEQLTIRHDVVSNESDVTLLPIAEPAKAWLYPDDITPVAE